MGHLIYGKWDTVYMKKSLLLTNNTESCNILYRNNTEKKRGENHGTKI